MTTTPTTTTNGCPKCGAGLCECRAVATSETYAPRPMTTTPTTKEDANAIVDREAPTPIHWQQTRAYLVRRMQGYIDDVDRLTREVEGWKVVVNNGIVVTKAAQQQRDDARNERDAANEARDEAESILTAVETERDAAQTKLGEVEERYSRLCKTGDALAVSLNKATDELRTLRGTTNGSKLATLEAKGGEGPYTVREDAKPNTGWEVCDISGAVAWFSNEFDARGTMRLANTAWSTGRASAGQEEEESIPQSAINRLQKCAADGCGVRTCTARPEGWLCFRHAPPPASPPAFKAKELPDLNAGAYRPLAVPLPEPTVCWHCNDTRTLSGTYRCPYCIPTPAEKEPPCQPTPSSGSSPASSLGGSSSPLPPTSGPASSAGGGGTTSDVAGITTMTSMDSTGAFDAVAGSEQKGTPCPDTSPSSGTPLNPTSTATTSAGASDLAALRERMEREVAESIYALRVDDEWNKWAEDLSSAWTALSALLDRHAEAMRACVVALERAGGMRGHNHWDARGTHGANCPLCIRQSEIMGTIRTALDLARPLVTPKETTNG